MRDFQEYSGQMSEWPKVELISGIENVLQALQGHYKLVIATNVQESGTVEMRRALKRVNAERYFNSFFSSRELEVAKPDRRFFMEIAKRLNVDPKECLVVGNSYERDIVPASQAGMLAVFFNEKVQAGDFSIADFLIHSMPELMLVIDQFSE